MATIKKSVAKRPLAKKQTGGPADAMRKAMGQKPTSTKETLKYVSKNGSGYIPPVKSDTTGRKKSALNDKAYIDKELGWKSASDTIRKKPAMLDSAEDAIMRNLGIKKSNKKDGAAMKTDFDKLGYKKGGAKKPLAKKQAGGSSDSTAVYSKTNIFGKTKPISENKAVKKSLKYSNKDKGTLTSEGRVFTAKPSPTSKRSITMDYSKTPVKKMGGATKKKC